MAGMAIDDFSDSYSMFYSAYRSDSLSILIRQEKKKGTNGFINIHFLLYNIL